MTIMFCVSVNVTLFWPTNEI